MGFIRALDGSVTVLGRRLPAVVAALMGLTFGLSIVSALGLHAGLPLAAMGALSPAAVWEGQVWRLLTWIFFELNPVGLVFALLVLWWFASDLARTWGPRRFLAVYLGFAVATAGLTCAIARFLWPTLMGALWAGNTAVVAALIIAWAVVFPHREILVYFLFPLGGRNLIYLTVGLTLLFAIYAGPGAVLPELLAEAVMLVYVREPTLYRFWLKLRLGSMYRSTRSRPSHLRAVGREDESSKPPRWLH